MTGANVVPFPHLPRDDAKADPMIEITAGLTKVYAVRIDGVIRNEFATATNAIRCVEHLRGLASLNALEPA